MNRNKTKGRSHLRQISIPLRMKGFTLVEILLAVFLISFLGSVIYSVFSQGIHLWNRSLSERASSDVALYFERLESDLRNAFYDSDKSFIGNSEMLEFSSLLPASHPEDKKQLGQFLGPFRLKYGYEFAGKMIERSRRIGFRDSLESFAGPKEQLLGSVSKCQYEYYYVDQKSTYEWLRDWRRPCLPAAVKIFIEVGDKNKLKSFSKIIMIPQGGCTA